MLGLAISSLMYITIGSKSLPNPVGMALFLYELAICIKTHDISIMQTNIKKTFLVIEKSTISLMSPDAVFAVIFSVCLSSSYVNPFSS